MAITMVTSLESFPCSRKSAGSIQYTAIMRCDLNPLGAPSVPVTAPESDTVSLQFRVGKTGSRSAPPAAGTKKMASGANPLRLVIGGGSVGANPVSWQGEPLWAEPAAAGHSPDSPESSAPDNWSQAAGRGRQAA